MDDRKVRIRVPAGSKGLVKPGKDNESGKMILPPGKLKVAEPDDDGTIVLELLEQNDSNKVLSDIEKRVQKTSTTMSGDERREAGKIVDSVRKKKIENLQRTGISPKKSSNYAKISESNTQIIREIRRSGGMAFDHFEVNQSVKKELEKLDSVYGTQYALDIDDAYDDFTDTVRSVLDAYRNPTGEVVEEEVKVSNIFKKVLEKKDNDEIIEILEKLALQIHAGFERFISIEANEDVLNFLSERKVFQRPSAVGSALEVQKDGDLMLGVARKTNISIRPVSGVLSHAGYKIKEKIQKNKNYKKEYYSEATKPKILLKPEVFGRSGYSRNAGLFDGAYSVSCVSKEKENITLAVLGGIKSSNSEKQNIDMLDVYLEAAVSGDYSQILGNKENPGFRAYVMGGFEKGEVEVIEYPMSMLDIESVKIKPRDPVLGEDTISKKLKSLGVSEDEISLFTAKGGPMDDVLKLEPVRIYLQRKAADSVKVELSQLNISNIRFVNPSGLDIFDPYSFQDLETRLLESGENIALTVAIRSIDGYLKSSVEKMKKEKTKKK